MLDFRVGDIVYTKDNPAWFGPMIIVEESDNGFAFFITVVHPEHGRGVFHSEALILDPISRSPLFEALR